MSKGSRTILFGTCLVAFASSAALAQSADPAEDPTGMDPAADPPTDPGTDPAADPMTDPAATPDPMAEPAAEAPASRWPREVINRPLTLPKGLAVVGADVSTSTSNFFDPAIVNLTAGYGITDDFEIGFGSYLFSTEDAGKGSLDLGLGYKLLRGAAGGKLEVIGRATTGYSLASEGMNPLVAGLQAQYNITPKLAVLMPGTHLSVALDGDPKPITFRIPVGVGVQATNTVYVQLDTTIATLNLKDSANAVIFSDTTPLTLSGYINVMPALDVILGVSADLTPPDPIGVDDTLAVMAGARYYIGQL